jgi:hypothetical protein
MSDTFGASDLNADTPGLGPQSGNERGPPVQLPSQLQGLVRHFFQQTQGNPNPKFLPPAPGPGGAQGGQRKKPDLGPVDPPDPMVRSIAPLPANAPQPPPKFAPFTPSMPRDHSQWGQPEAFPRLPQSFELPGMYQKLGGYFAQNGSFASAPLGAGMAAFSKEYQEGYMKGQEWKMRMAKEQLGLHAAQLAELEQRQSVEYADIYNMYSEKGGDLNTQTIGGRSLHDAIWAKAVELGDKNVIAMLEDGQSVEKVRRYQMDHEARIRDLSKANAKQTEADAAAELYGLHPPSAAGTDPWDRGPTQPGETTQPAAPTGEVAGPGAPSGDKDTRAPGVGDPLDKTKPSDEGENADDIGDPEQRRMHDASISVLKGIEPQDIPKSVLPYAGINARTMRDKMGNIMDRAKRGELAPDQVIPEIRKQIGGQVANDLQSVLDYRMPGVGGGGQGGGTGGKEGDYKALLGNIAAVIDPGDPAKGHGGWVAANYQAQERFRTDVNTQTVILRSNSLAADGNSVMADLKELERRGVPSEGLDLSSVIEYAKRDPIYSKLAGDWKAYNDAFNTVVSAGHHTETGAQAQESVAPVSYASPSAFRAAIKGHMQDALGYLEGEHQRWETIGGKEHNMPSYNPKTEKQLRDLRDMDYLTGTMPGQTYTSKSGITKTWVGGNLNPYDPSNWK